MAVPDRLIGKSRTNHRQGAARHRARRARRRGPARGLMPERKDVTFFVTHPCHPPIFNDETTPKPGTTSSAAARQAAHRLRADAGAGGTLRAVRRRRAHDLQAGDALPPLHGRNIAIMEPALSETVATTLCLPLRRRPKRRSAAACRAGRDGLPSRPSHDRACHRVRRHARGPFSDGALHAIDRRSR